MAISNVFLIFAVVFLFTISKTSAGCKDDIAKCKELVENAISEGDDQTRRSILQSAEACYKSLKAKCVNDVVKADLKAIEAMRNEASTDAKEPVDPPEESTNRNEQIDPPEESTNRNEQVDPPEESTNRNEQIDPPEESTQANEQIDPLEESTPAQKTIQPPEEFSNFKLPPQGPTGYCREVVYRDCLKKRQPDDICPAWNCFKQLHKRCYDKGFDRYEDEYKEVKDKCSDSGSAILNPSLLALLASTMFLAVCSKF